MNYLSLSTSHFNALFHRFQPLPSLNLFNSDSLSLSASLRATEMKRDEEEERRGKEEEKVAAIII